jgi:hypothetical protein
MSLQTIDVQRIFIPGVGCPSPERSCRQGRSLAVMSRVAHRRDKRGSCLRGRSVADRGTHAPQAAGSIPAPATNTMFPGGYFVDESGELCRWATRRECGLFIFFSALASVLLCVLVLGGCHLLAGGCP